MTQIKISLTFSYTLAILVNFLIGFPQARAGNISFSQDAEIENLKTTEKKSLKKAETLSFSNETPYLIRMADKIPVLLIPVDSSRSDIQIDGYPLANLVELRSQKEVDRLLSGLLLEIGDIQTLTRRRQFDLAFQKLDQLQKKYPGLSSLGFLRASLLYLNGKRADSEVVLKEALALQPDNAEGLKLLQEMKRN